MKAYHYTECGLSDIWLSNGYEVVETSFGEGVRVENVEDLHRAIGDVIARPDTVITGERLKFMRAHMDMTQEHLGKILGYESGQMVAASEKKKTDPIEIKSASIILLRLLYSEWLRKEASSVFELVEKLSQLNQESYKQRKMEFNLSDSSWEPLAA